MFSALKRYAAAMLVFWGGVVVAIGIWGLSELSDALISLAITSAIALVLLVVAVRRGYRNIKSGKVFDDLGKMTGTASSVLDNTFGFGNLSLGDEGKGRVPRRDPEIDLKDRFKSGGMF